MQTEAIDISLIEVAGTRRPVNPETVEGLCKSIQEIGLRTPITVLDVDGGAALRLVAGRHRLEAAKALGWDKIDAFVMEGEGVEAEMWEISENLHRAELTTLQRDEQIARWIELAEAREVLRQVDAKPQGGRPEGGRRAAAREIGISEPNARRATKVASISERAKQAAIEAGLDNNRSALLGASRMPTEEAQIEYIKGYAAPKPQDDDEVTERQLGALMAAWNKAGNEAREVFLVRIGASWG